MKKALIVALICAMIGYAQSVRTAVTSGTDCSGTDKTCPTTDCCGTATPVQGSQTKQVCYTRGETRWIDSNNGYTQYYFACNSAEHGSYLVASIGVLLATVALVEM